MRRTYRVHLIGLTKQDPRVTREYDQVSTMEGGWLRCVRHQSGEQPKAERWYPPTGVLSVEVVEG